MSVLWGLLGSVGSSVWGWIAGGALTLAVYFGIFRKGETAQVAADQSAELKVAQDAKTVSDRVDTMSPAQLDSVLKPPASGSA